MADEKNTAENEAPKKAAAPRRRTAKTTIKKEPVERSQTDHKEEKRMTQKQPEWLKPEDLQHQLRQLTRCAKQQMLHLLEREVDTTGE